MSESDAREDNRKMARRAPPFVEYPLAALQAILTGIHSLGQLSYDRAGGSPSSSDAQAAQMLLLQELERERHRIAMDLHDGLGPLITLIKLELHNAKLLMGSQCDDLHLAHAAIQRAEDNVARAFDELRRAVLDLRPAMLDDLGIVHALRWLIRQFELSGTDIDIQSKLMADDRVVPNALKIVIFRICQETLNNVIKHAQASHVAVELGITGADLVLSIEDDGRGMAFATADVFTRSGGGLAGIARRANSSNGKLTVDSADGRGTRLVIRWPLAPTGAPRTGPSDNDDPLASVI